eukprot:11205162-Ditylum_brightwellii.AAC.1
MATIASTVSKFRSMIPCDDMHFKCMNLAHQCTMDKLELTSRLKPNQQVIVPAFGKNFFAGMGLFQHNTTKICMGERNKCSMLIPPISREDKTTKKGVVMVTLSLLALFGIMEGQTLGGEH